MKLSVPEQRLLAFARETFGERLTEFLTAGLGEDVTSQRWRFRISYAGGEGATLKRRLEVITYEPTDGSSYLPRRRDPLVLIALLRLLLEGDHISSNLLRYKQEDVLSLLGRKDSPKAREEIDGAVRRYFLLIYQWKMNRSELKNRNLAFYNSQENMISECEFLDSEAEGSDRVERVLNRIVFNQHFIERLLSRSLFGVEWDQVRSVKIV